MFSRQNPNDCISVGECFELNTPDYCHRELRVFESTRVLFDNPNHRLTGSSLPMRNKQHGIGIEVNAWSLKARGFQQVLSRN